VRLSKSFCSPLISRFWMIFLVFNFSYSCFSTASVKKLIWWRLMFMSFWVRCCQQIGLKKNCVFLNYFLLTSINCYIYRIDLSFVVSFLLRWSLSLAVFPQPIRRDASPVSSASCHTAKILQQLSSSSCCFTPFPTLWLFGLIVMVCWWSKLCWSRYWRRSLIRLGWWRKPRQW